jgi:putative transposase
MKLRKVSHLPRVNAPQTEAEFQAVWRSVERGGPFGDESWTEQTVHRLGLEPPLRPRGRPVKPLIGS